MRTVCVFCGSNPGAERACKEAARALGLTLAEAGMTLVYGGGRVGLMGVVADATLGAGGEAIGVMLRSLVEREIGHTGLTKSSTSSPPCTSARP